MTQASDEVLRARTTAVRTQELDGTLVLHHASGRFLQLNETGRLLWALLGEGVTVDALVAALAATYEVDAARAAADVEAFLGLLRDQGLLDGT